MSPNIKDPATRKIGESFRLSPSSSTFIDEVAQDALHRKLSRGKKPNRSFATDVCIAYAKFAKSKGVDIFAVMRVK